jgi:hypothetical protein
MMPKIALIFICTGSDYHKFLQPALESAKKYFPADILLFTDHPEQWDVARQVYLPHAPWPAPTLMRYHTILQESEWLAQYEYVFYMDVDLLILQPIGDEILSDGITAVEHISFVGKPGTPEEDRRSTACLPKTEIQRYYIGGVIGGTTTAFLEMAATLRTNIDTDLANNYLAVWHDESHSNRYLCTHPPALVLGADYNAWQQRRTTKILRAEKKDAQGKWINRPAVNGKQPKT